MTKSAEFYISPSSLERFFTCPYQYHLARTWTPLRPPPPWIADGLLVHRWMAGERGLDLSPRAQEHVKRLEAAVEGWKITQREVRQKVEVAKNLYIVRIIDAVAEDPVTLIDYKTTGKAWDAVPDAGGNGIAPMALGWQAVSYLVPPDGEEWPNGIWFIVSSSDHKTAALWPYGRRKEREKELVQAIRIVANAVSKSYYPKRCGKMCAFCDWQEMCYEVPGAWQNYEEKVKEDHDVKLD